LGAPGLLVLGALIFVFLQDASQALQNGTLEKRVMRRLLVAAQSGLQNSYEIC